MEENIKIDQHISQRYNADLEALRSRVLTMGGLVEKQCQQALEALVKGDSELWQPRITRSTTWRWKFQPSARISWHAGNLPPATCA